MYTIETRTIVTPQNGLNIYRGKTENSIICADPDSEDIGIKLYADELLYNTLKKRKGKGVIFAGNMADPYNNLEADTCLMRKCLNALEMTGFGVVITTRRKLLLRDIDILKRIHDKTKAIVEIPLPSIDVEKLRLIDGGSLTERLELMKGLKDEGIPFIINIYPLVPYVNDGVIVLKSMLGAVMEYGPHAIDLGGIRIPYVKKQMDYFYKEYESRFPEEYKKYTGLYGKTKELIHENSEELMEAVRNAAKRAGAISDPEEILDFKRRYENKYQAEQITIFDEV